MLGVGEVGVRARSSAILDPAIGRIASNNGDAAREEAPSLSSGANLGVRDDCFGEGSGDLSLAFRGGVCALVGGVRCRPGRRTGIWNSSSPGVLMGRRLPGSPCGVSTGTSTLIVRLGLPKCLERWVSKWLGEQSFGGGKLTEESSARESPSPDGSGPSSSPICDSSS